MVRAYQRHPAHVAGSLRQLPVRDTDSPLEGSGFELLVPRYETPEDFWSIPGILGGYGKVPPIRMRCVPQNGTASLVKVPAPSGPPAFSASRCASSSFLSANLAPQYWHHNGCHRHSGRFGGGSCALSTRACRLTVPLLKSGVGYRGDTLRSFTVGRGSAVPGGRMARAQQPRLGEQLLAQGAGQVLTLVDAALLQNRHDQIDEVVKALGGHDAAEVETVDIGFFDPGDQVVRRAGGVEATGCSGPAEVVLL